MIGWLLHMRQDLCYTFLKEYSIMKNKKKKQSPANANRFKILTIVFMFTTFLLGGVLLFSASRLKKPDEIKYLKLYPALLQSHVMSFCPRIYAEKDDSTVSWCEAKDYGVSKDGDPFVIFEEQKYEG